MEIDPPTTAQDSSITDQLTDKNTNQTQPTPTQSQNLLSNEPKSKPNPSYNWLFNFSITKKMEVSNQTLSSALCFS